MDDGITLVELLLVIAIILLLGAISSPFLTRFIVQNQYLTTSDKVISTIRKSQAYAMNNKGSSVWGVCISGTAIRLYQGSCNAPSFSEDFDIPAAVSISGLSDTTFSPGRGEPNQTLTITISASVGTTTLSLNRGGGMSIQ